MNMNMDKAREDGDRDGTETGQRRDRARQGYVGVEQHKREKKKGTEMGSKRSRNGSSDQGAKGARREIALYTGDERGTVTVTVAQAMAM